MKLIDDLFWILFSTFCPRVSVKINKQYSNQERIGILSFYSLVAFLGVVMMFRFGFLPILITMVFMSIIGQGIITGTNNINAFYKDYTDWFDIWVHRLFINLSFLVLFGLVINNFIKWFINFFDFRQSE
ncbi:MAG: hypothetical protein KJ674_03310 [Nanoarchaeota archaeon]|nr:hypothetical protein [Nanoarchaeota archaeon]